MSVPEDDFSLKIRGLTKFRATLKAAGVNMADMKDANVAAARTVQQRSQAIGPQRTGALVGSLRTPRAVSRARVSSSLVYAPVIHWGWPKRNIRRNRFVMRAAEQTRPVWMDEYEASLQHISNTVKGA